MTDRAAIPARIGPVEFGELGRLIAVRCPHDFDHLMRKPVANGARLASLAGRTAAHWAGDPRARSDD
jgi:hypothetical protein